MANNRSKAPTQEPDRLLVSYTEKINKLGRRMISDVVEIGATLILAKKRAGHGHWLDWLKTVGLTHDAASKFMRIAKLLRSAKFRRYRNMATPLAVLSKL